MDKSGSGQHRRKSYRALRIFAPAIVIAIWFAGAAVGGPYFGKVDEVTSNDATAYLPDSAQATTVQKQLPKFNGSDAIPAVAVFVSDSEISDADIKQLQQRVAAAAKLDVVSGDASPVMPSRDKKAAQAFIPIDSDADVAASIDQVRDHLASGLPDGVNLWMTGPAGLSADLGAAFSGIDGLLLGVALAAVFVILVLVYRSALLPIAVLATSLFALCVALLTVWWLAKADLLMLSGQTQGILFILVIGAATDYALLYTARYREELRETQSTAVATVRAWKGAVEPILASGGTVIAGLLCLLLSDLKSNSTLGPVASIGIAFAMLSALTLLPALLYALGRTAFWPRRPHYVPATDASDSAAATHAVWNKVAHWVQRHARPVWALTALVLLAGSLGVLQLKANGVAQSELVLGTSEAREGQDVLGEHFPGGSGSPTYVLIADDRLEESAKTLLANDGVASVAVSSKDSPSGSAPVTPEGVQAVGPGPAPKPTVVDGQVLIQATLTAAADSLEAEETVREVRDGLPDSALVGGPTATDIDTNDAAKHDRALIIPVVLVLILLILMLLLRAVVAPILLIISTVISFGTALGVAALVFNHVFKFPGADPAVPLYGFVFLVALGIDYNIFLMTRVREESLHHGTREGVLRGLTITGGVITSAGVVLAATFAALSVIPILFLAQLAFIVAFGVLLDTLVVRSLLVPALIYDIGPLVWWPSKRLKK